MDLDFREHFGSNITYFLCYVINYLYAERPVTVLVPFHLLHGMQDTPVTISVSSVALYAGHVMGICHQLPSMQDTSIVIPMSSVA
jgi:hypothetical protein